MVSRGGKMRDDDQYRIDGGLMRAGRVVVVSLSVALAGLSLPGAAQDGPLSHTVVNAQLNGSKQFLLEHNIGLDPASLRAALKDADPMVRGAAATQLAQNKITEAIPDVEAALAAETDRMNKIRLMGSLALLQPKDESNIALQSCRSGSLA